MLIERSNVLSIFNQDSTSSDTCQASLAAYGSSADTTAGTRVVALDHCNGHHESVQYAKLEAAISGWLCHENTQLLDKSRGELIRKIYTLLAEEYSNSGITAECKIASLSTNSSRSGGFVIFSDTTAVFLDSLTHCGTPALPFMPGTWQRAKKRFTAPNIGFSQCTKKAESLLESVYSFVRNNQKLEAFDIVCDAIETEFSSESTYFTNQLLLQIDPKKAGRFVAVGLLRTAFRARELLPAWDLCIKKVSFYLESENENVNRVMRGLIPSTNAAQLANQKPFF